ncbi:MAG TPA: oxalate decarboxylase family bicupin [Terriglobales bacterium]|nr:oxalate decarboxylase family bicupin [Terriglobales bacterium]
MSDIHDLTRRSVLKTGVTALTAGTLTNAFAQQTSNAGDRTSSNPGPANPPLAAQNQDSFMPPLTDHGDTPAFKYSFSLSHNRTYKGGWARQVTVRDFPISKELAGVNMRLTAGGIRELHWHVPAEWAYMIYGKARITAVDSQGRSFVQDVEHGDLWYFPSGIPHSIQGLGPDGCEFLLVFDDGGFSEFDTFQISDWMAHTPREVLAKNFGVQAAALAPIPERELYIFEAPLPGSLAGDQQATSGSQGAIPSPYFYRLGAQEPAKRSKGGEVRIADSKSFIASTTVAAALVTVRPGGLRELHWHPNADEWQYYIGGNARMTVFAASGRARTMDFAPGDVGYVLRSTGHYIENTGDTDLVFLETFKSSHYQDISLSQWIAHTPPELVAAHLHIDKATLAAIPREKAVILPL